MIESTLFPIVSKINECLSNYILIFLLVGVGLWYSIRTRFVQVRCFGEGMKKFFGEMNLRGGAQKSGMTSFQALATAIAAQVGTGNIVGASGACVRGCRRSGGRSGQGQQSRAAIHGQRVAEEQPGQQAEFPVRHGYRHRHGILRQQPGS